MWRSLLGVLGFLTLASALRADGPGDNVADKVRRVPPPGIALAAADREELKNGSDALGHDIESLRAALKDKPDLLDLLPDIQIFHNAVRYALDYDEFFNAREIPVARALLKQAEADPQRKNALATAWKSVAGMLPNRLPRFSSRFLRSRLTGMGQMPQWQRRQTQPDAHIRRDARLS